MKIFRDIRLLFGRKLKETLRNPVYIFMGITSPIIYLALFAPLLKNFAGTRGFPTDNILSVFVPGMLAMVAFFNGIFAGWGIIDELRSGVIERFRVTPCSRFAILAGPVFRDLVGMLFQTLLFVLIAIPFGFRINPVGLILLYILLALLLSLTSSLTNALGLITKSEDKLAPIIHGINLPVMLLSGMLLPMNLAPTWLKVIAHFNPVYYVVEAARDLSAGSLFTPVVGEAFLILIPLTVFVMWWATGVFRRATM
jgi:ABC-2 type transport system permease protein